MKPSSTESCVKALRVLSQEIQSEDGVANAALAECAYRMENLAELVVSQQERIKRLEEAGDDMYGYINHSHSSVSSIEVYNVLTNWAKAKENKP
mgnify:CR=1 FL=1